MARAKQRDAWDHTAHLLTLVYNAMQTRAIDCKEVEEMHPFLCDQWKAELLARMDEPDTDIAATDA